jgi:Glycosyltransferase
MPRREARADSGKPVTIGVAARLAPVKGLEDLITALSLLKGTANVHVEIAGAGPSSAELERKVAEARLSKVVKFLGWRDDVDALMSGWDIYVQPSLAEGFGIAAVEAMASGLPVVATNVGGLSEIVVDGETGILVPARDPAALAKSIERLVDDPALRLQMGETVANGCASFQHRAGSAAIESAYDKLLA